MRSPSTWALPTCRRSAPSWPGRAGRPITCRWDTGNPHAVRFNQPPDEEIAALGRALADGAHEAFPHGVNLEFVRQRIRGVGPLEVIVWERGVGLTQACGTGACAVAAAAWACGRAPDGAPLEVRLPGGALVIQRDRGGQIWMRGPAEIVYEATLDEGWVARKDARRGGGTAVRGERMEMREEWIRRRWSLMALGGVAALALGGCESGALVLSHGFAACATTLMLWSTLNVVGRRR